MLETPSRIWRRIEEVEDRDMPSLPSLPGFEDSDDRDTSSSSAILDIDDDRYSIEPVESTPAASSHRASTLRAASSTSSTARFANSIASRSTKSSASSGLRGTKSTSAHSSFNAVVIPSLPQDRSAVGTSRRTSDGGGELAESIDSVPEVYLPPDEDDEGFSLTEALASMERSRVQANTPKKVMEYSVSLRSEPKASPIDKFRNINVRKPLARTRTPSLSRTTPSPASSPTNSTPHSHKSLAFENSLSDSPIPGLSVPLPRSRTASPAVFARHRVDEESDSVSPVEESTRREGHQQLDDDDEEKTMDETDIHISPIVSDADRCEPTASQDDREPTFSSEDASEQSDTQRAAPMNSYLNSFPSPSPSAFTPTPAIPRRAHFDVDETETPRPSEMSPEETPRQIDEEPLTPHTRRRSFLLSVINSNARPRMKFPTPHPRMAIQDTPSAAESTPAGPSSGIGLQSAFAGVTPRPRAVRGRASHPLAQGFTASPGSPDFDGQPGSPVPELEQEEEAHIRSLPPWATPRQGSPYDAGSDRASFISTASSHDLTTHHRANTSFDAVMGLGAQGHGLNRFNSGKLNAYLHGLNRRLQEENEVLLERVRQMEESTSGKSGVASTSGRRSSAGSRRVSLAATTLGNVEEDVGAEGWMEEKAELEGMIDGLETHVAQCAAEKEDAEKALEVERAERVRDKERWKERMLDVEKGVEGIVRDLEKKLEEAEKRAKRTEDEGAERGRAFANQLADLEAERDDALDRAAQAEQALESGKELGGELRSANERISQLLGDLRNANSQIKDLEGELAQYELVDRELQEEKELVETLETELQAKVDELVAQKEMMESEVQKVEEELAATKAYVAELDQDAGAAAEVIESLERKLEAAQAEIKAHVDSEELVHRQLEDLETKEQRSAELARQMEEALEVAEKKMVEDEEHVAELQGRIQTLEKERELVREKSFAIDPSQRQPTDEEFEALEMELDSAHQEIARLTTLLHQSPARKAMDKARDTKIEMLEREKEELVERVKALRTTVTDMNTPTKLANTSGISPFHRHVLSMSVRDPRTPGGPLKELSWLKDSPSGPAISPLIEEISRLQRELDKANESIDDKLDKLEDAGLGVVGLTTKLEDARHRINALEDEVARLMRKEERRVYRLERLRCKKCLTKVDVQSLVTGDDRELSLGASTSSLPTEPPTPPTKTSEALRANLHAVNSDLADLRKRWAEEKHQLLGEKAVLQDATTRLNAQISNAREEARKAAQSGRASEQVQSAIQQELDNAKQVIAELEGDLKAERSRIRALGAEQNRVQREKDDVRAQLQRTESDMTDVKAHLQRMRQENHELEGELRQNATADQKARLLEAKLASTVDTIEQLRQERSLLAADHKQLQRRFTEVAEQAAKLQDERTASQTSHDNRRHQLDLHLSEIDDLRRALSNQASELQRAEAEKNRIAAEKSRIAAERSDVVQTISTLESELRRVKKDAEVFGRDLKLLRLEKDRVESKRRDETEKAERSRKQAQAQIRVLNEQLEGQREKTAHAREELENHVCAADDRQLVDLKAKHKDECKGLLVNIRYLHAKFARESLFRLDLRHQKEYLLVLLAQFEKSERTIISSIARIGFPLPPPPRPRKTRKLKVVTLSIVFALRARSASNAWREHTTTKSAVVAAHQEVRRRRAAALA
ncbi:hypothetical protein HGRIS_005160 [Hohenbuehelia grisea]|uniref:Pericentrin/AKAP-450 centrosomal targeting domain-containing protein n=1 Tax=Hohenbuehelia grisea TaxID=104357 RepID=A0ABR3JE45_9AGAR